VWRAGALAGEAARQRGYVVQNQRGCRRAEPAGAPAPPLRTVRVTNPQLDFGDVFPLGNIPSNQLVKFEKQFVLSVAPAPSPAMPRVSAAMSVQTSAAVAAPSRRGRRLPH
jgi:hypothetical protein